MIWLYLILLGLVVALAFSLNAAWQTLRTGLPFVSTPDWAINWLSNNLDLKSSDIFYELGCGDARVLAALARKFPAASFIGIEIQWWPYALAKWRTRGLANVKIVRGNIFKTDLRAATCVFGFYITNFVNKLAPFLKQSLRPGARVISYGFPLPGWQPEHIINDPHGKTKIQLLVYHQVA